MDHGFPERRIGADSVLKRLSVQRRFHVRVHCQSQNCRVKTVKYGRHIEFPVFCFDFGYARDAFFEWFCGREIPFQQVIRFARLTVSFCNPVWSALWAVAESDFLHDAVNCPPPPGMRMPSGCFNRSA